jgi:hypothetical protein
MSDFKLKAFRCHTLFEVIEHMSRREVRVMGLATDLVNKKCTAGS